MTTTPHPFLSRLLASSSDAESAAIVAEAEASGVTVDDLLELAEFTLAYIMRTRA